MKVAKPTRSAASLAPDPAVISTLGAEGTARAEMRQSNAAFLGQEQNCARGGRIDAPLGEREIGGGPEWPSRALNPR